MNGCHGNKKFDNSHFGHQRESIIVVEPIVEYQLEMNAKE